MCSKRSLREWQKKKGTDTCARSSSHTIAPTWRCGGRVPIPGKQQEKNMPGGRSWAAVVSHSALIHDDTKKEVQGSQLSLNVGLQDCEGCMLGTVSAPCVDGLV